MRASAKPECVCFVSFPDSVWLRRARYRETKPITQIAGRVNYPDFRVRGPRRRNPVTQATAAQLPDCDLTGSQSQPFSRATARSVSHIWARPLYRLKSTHTRRGEPSRSTQSTPRAWRSPLVATTAVGPTHRRACGFTQACFRHFGMEGGFVTSTPSSSFPRAPGAAAVPYRNPGGMSTLLMMCTRPLVHPTSAACTCAWFTKTCRRPYGAGALWLVTTST